jgi:hypothetical protein
VLRAISTGTLNRLQAAAEDVRDLKPAQRAQLPLRIRPDAVAAYRARKAGQRLA